MHECYQEKRLNNLEKNKDVFNRFMGEMKTSIINIEKNINDIVINHIRHLNQKLNWLLFCVLASVFASVIIIAIKTLIGKG